VFIASVMLQLVSSVFEQAPATDLWNYRPIL